MTRINGKNKGYKRNYDLEALSPKTIEILRIAINKTKYKENDDLYKITNYLEKNTGKGERERMDIDNTVRIKLAVDRVMKGCDE